MHAKSLKKLTKLMGKKVSRKEFLLYVGFILFAVTGISSVWKNISSIVNDNPQKGFGNGPYGA